MNNHDIHEVSDGKLVIEGVNAKGFALVPMPGTLGRYPLVATINDVGATPIVIDGPHVYSQAEEVSRLVVDVSLGGGQDGDKWRLLRKPELSDRRESVYATNTRGQLVTSPDSEVLFFFDSREPAHRQALFEAFDWSPDYLFDNTFVTVDPIWRNRFGNSAPRSFGNLIFDVSRFRRVRFVAELYPTNTFDWSGNSVRPVVCGLGPDGGKAIESIYMGSLGEFGGPSEPLPAGGVVGVVDLGAPGPESETTYTRSTPRLPPHLGFALDCQPAGAEMLNLFGEAGEALYPGLVFRMYAVGY